jgi:hypothetical protein
MTSLSDTLTVGLVLVLLFGAVALYLYTRIQQAEQKITLLESILLDLKMSTEVHSYSELPASIEHENDSPKGQTSTEAPSEESYTPFLDEHDSPSHSVEESTPSDNSIGQDAIELSDHDVDQYKAVVAEAAKEESFESVASESKGAATHYDTMTLKELQALAKTRGISGASTMKKPMILEALKTSDKSQQGQPLDAGFTGSSGSFLETSAAFPASESK